MFKDAEEISKVLDYNNTLHPHVLLHTTHFFYSFVGLDFVFLVMHTY